MSAHSPGPWGVDTGDTHDGPAIVSAEGEAIASFYGDDETAQADARLIAAAPELLAALRRYVSGATIDEETAIADSRAAWALIARIEGGK